MDKVRNSNEYFFSRSTYAHKIQNVDGRKCEFQRSAAAFSPEAYKRHFHYSNLEIAEKNLVETSPPTGPENLPGMASLYQFLICEVKPFHIRYEYHYYVT